MGECKCGNPTHYGLTSYYGDWCPQVGTGIQSQVGTGSESSPYRYHYTWNTNTCQYEESGCTNIPASSTTPKTPSEEIVSCVLIEREEGQQISSNGMCGYASIPFHNLATAYRSWEYRYQYTEAGGELCAQMAEHIGEKAHGRHISVSCGWICLSYGGSSTFQVRVKTTPLSESCKVSELAVK